MTPTHLENGFRYGLFVSGWDQGDAVLDRNRSQVLLMTTPSSPRSSFWGALLFLGKGGGTVEVEVPEVGESPHFHASFSAHWAK